MMKILLKKICNYYKQYEELTNYLIVGFLTVLISLVSYSLLSVIFDPNHPLLLQVNNVLSWVFAVIFAYICNKKYVFKSKNRSIKKEFFSFVTSRIVTLLLDMLVMFLMVTILLFNDTLSKLISQGLVIIINYILSKFIVFKR